MPGLARKFLGLMGWLSFTRIWDWIWLGFRLDLGWISVGCRFDFGFGLIWLDSGLDLIWLDLDLI